MLSTGLNQLPWAGQNEVISDLQVFWDNEFDLGVMAVRQWFVGRYGKEYAVDKMISAASVFESKWLPHLKLLVSPSKRSLKKLCV